MNQEPNSTNSDNDSKSHNLAGLSWYIAQLNCKFHEYRSQKKQERAENPSEYRVANATVWIAIFTAVLMVVAFLQYCTLQKTNETAQATSRAYVYFDRVRLIENVDSDGKPVFAVVATIMNSGTTPSRELRALVDCALVPQTTAEDPFILLRKENNALAPLFLGPSSLSD